MQHPLPSMPEDFFFFNVRTIESDLEGWGTYWEAVTTFQKVTGAPDQTRASSKIVFELRANWQHAYQNYRILQLMEKP